MWSSVMEWRDVSVLWMVQGMGKSGRTQLMVPTEKLDDRAPSDFGKENRGEKSGRTLGLVRILEMGSRKVEQVLDVGLRLV